MLKGVNRNVIMVKTDPKSRFEAVYFILKKDGAAHRTDVVREANRIIAESGACKGISRPRVRIALIASLSAVLGAALTLGVCLLIFL